MVYMSKLSLGKGKISALPSTNPGEEEGKGVEERQRRKGEEEKERKRQEKGDDFMTYYLFHYFFYQHYYTYYYYQFTMAITVIQQFLLIFLPMIFSLSLLLFSTDDE